MSSWPPGVGTHVKDDAAHARFLKRVQRFTHAGHRVAEELIQHEIAHVAVENLVFHAVDADVVALNVQLQRLLLAQNAQPHIRARLALDARGCHVHGFRRFGGNRFAVRGQDHVAGRSPAVCAGLFLNTRSTTSRPCLSEETSMPTPQYWPL